MHNPFFLVNLVLENSIILNWRDMDGCIKANDNHTRWVKEHVFMHAKDEVLRPLGCNILHEVGCQRLDVLLNLILSITELLNKICLHEFFPLLHEELQEVSNNPPKSNQPEWQTSLFRCYWYFKRSTVTKDGVQNAQFWTENSCGIFRFPRF